jgi:rhamnogalacturonan endolyase
MENLGRGVIAVRTDKDKVNVGWRMLAVDPQDVSYNLYRTTGNITKKLNREPLTRTTDFVDTGADFSLSNSYFVRAVIHGVEQPASAPWPLAANAPVRQYLDIPLQMPAAGTSNCAGVTSSYEFRAGDGSIGDLDGDGQYEIVLKWDPTNARDNSQNGCTGPTLLDAYKLDGTRLWRIDLGPNIRSGAHYTQFMVYDLDGDGKAEVVVKTADGSIDGAGKAIGNPAKLWADATGRIMNGPEYLTVFDGKTCAALASADYVPGRGDVCSWGDCRANRADRFLAGVAYLDGVHPSVVMARGYYTRAVLAAWDWRNGKLTQRWVFDTTDPKHPEYKKYEGQGNHSLSVADVNGDGKDEIIYGSAVINNDGTGLYSTGWGHGDALHVSRFDPANPDLLVFTIHEGCHPWAKTLYNARTGALIAGTNPDCKSDPGRGMIAAIDPKYQGAYFWGGGGGPALYDMKGRQVTSYSPRATNFAVWWDADNLRELEDRTFVLKYDPATNATNTLLACAECMSNNGTKATPVLSGDLFGDWREEIIWRTADNRHLRIYTTAIPAANRMYTLAQDSQYRLALAWQNVAYKQPPWPSFYIGPGMNDAPRPNIVYPANLQGRVAGKSGAAVRAWRVEVTNVGTASANAAELQGLMLTQVSGHACVPTVKTPFPVKLGDIAAGAKVSADVSIDFSSCPGTAQFEVSIPVSALQGGATYLITGKAQTR